MAVLPLHSVLGEEEEILIIQESKCVCVYLHVCIKRKSQATELSAALLASVTPESMRISSPVWTKGPSVRFGRLAVELIPRKE